MFLEDASFISDWEDTEDLTTKVCYAFASETSISTACCSASCNALAQLASMFCVLLLSGINEGTERLAKSCPLFVCGPQ